MLARVERAQAVVVGALVLLTTAFALYTGAVGPYEAPVQRGVFVLLMLPLVFLLTRSWLPWPRPVEKPVRVRTTSAETAVSLSVFPREFMALRLSIFVSRACHHLATVAYPA